MKSMTTPIPRKVERPNIPRIARVLNGLESPAPWKAVKRNEGMYGVVDYEGWPVPGCHNCGENAGVYEPNQAKLIAAAPDLLNYIDYLEQRIGIYGPDDL